MSKNDNYIYFPLVMSNDINPGGGGQGHSRQPKDFVLGKCM
jgi:hypothetical protein